MGCFNQKCELYFTSINCQIQFLYQIVVFILLVERFDKMYRLDNPICFPQIQFLDHIVVPVYRTLADLHPAAEEPYQVTIVFASSSDVLLFS